MSYAEDDPRRPVATTTSVKAIFSLLFGMLALLLPIVAAIPALILGFLGLRDINQSEGRLGGKGLAIAGMITSVVASLVGLVAMGVGAGILLLIPATQKVREAA